MGAKLARDTGNAVFQTYRVIVHREQALLPQVCSHRFASTGLPPQVLLPQVLFPQKYSIHKPPLTRRRIDRWRRRPRLAMQLQPQPQVVRRVGIFQRFFLIDGALDHQVEQRVIEGLHPQFL